MVLHNAAVTGSLTVNGVDVSSITGSSPTSASFASQIASLNAATASLNTYTSSNNTNISALNAQSASFLAYTASNDAKITSLNTFSSSILSYTSSNDAQITSIYSTTSSLNSYTSSANTKFAGLDAASGSAITRLNALEVASGSAITRLSLLETASGSAITRLGALETASGSAITRLGALEVASGSAINRLSSLETASGSAITRLNSIENKTGSYATTGSNTFVGGQYFSSSFNPTGFTTTASLYTDGGLRVTKDAYISGTLYLNNVTVFGTQSVAYISSSQLNIGTNIITVNTDTPSVRFGGLAVYDSGSTGLTGSMLWDSQANHWIYSNPSGSSYSGGMFISGPRTSTLGSETGTTSCMLMAGQGGDHITSSMIYHSSTATCIPNTLIGSTVCSTMANASCIGIGTTSPLTKLDVIGNIRNSNAGQTVYTEIQNDGLYASGTDLYLLAPASKFMSFYAGGNERLRIASTGVSCFACQVCVPNIISTGVSGGRYATFNAPTNGGYITFEAGGTAFGDLGSYCAQYGTGDATTLSLQSRTGYALALGTNSTEKVRIDTTGNLMVGSLSAGNAGTINVSVGCAGTTAGGLQLWASSAQTHYVQFGDGTAGAGPYAGYVGYAHSTDTLLLGAGAATRAIITSAGVACFSSTVCTPSLVACVTSAAAITIDGYSKLSFKDRGTEYGTINASRYNFGGESTLMTFQSGNCFLFLNGTNCLMFIGSSGNVGIGTNPFSWASGWRALEVGASGVIAYTGAGANDLSYTLNSYFDSADNRWEYRYTGDGAARYSITALTSEHRWFNAPVGTANAAISWTQAMTLTSTGNLGIGITTPCALLHIASSSSNSVLWPAILNNPYNDGVSGYGVGLRLQNSTTNSPQENNKWAGVAAIAGGSSGYSNETDLAFYVGCFILAANCTCPPVEKMRIQSSTGNVGIGTTSPASKFQIGSVGSTGYSISNGLAIGNGTQASALDVDASGLNIYSTNNIIFSPNTTERMRINASGDLELKGRSTTTNFQTVFYNDNSQLAINATNTSTGKTINFNPSSTFNALSIASNGNTSIAGDLSLTPTNSALIFSNGFARIFMGSTEAIRISSTGIACFACQVCAPTFKGYLSGNSTGYPIFSATSCTLGGVSTDVTVYFTSSITIDYGVNDYTVFAYNNANAAENSSLRALIPYNYYQTTPATTVLASYIDTIQGHSALAVAVCKASSSSNTYCIAVRFAVSSGNVSGKVIQLTSNGIQTGFR
jgi:hypothetical protein